MKGSTNSSVGDRVAYHSERQMGSPYRESGKKFSFWSNKSEKHLRSALGQRIWIITSEGATKLRFFLAGYYTPDAITSKNNVRSLEGSGTHLPRRIEITELLWFKELFKEQNNFSYGNFSRIRSALVIDGLRRISAAASRSSTATTSAMQEMREDPKKAGEMLEAVLSTVSRSTRLFAVDLLGRVLANAETHFPDRWTLTLHPNRVRFIAGMVMCLQFTRSGRTSVVLLRKATPRRLWKGSGEYTNAPECIEVFFDDLEKFAREYPLLRGAHEDAMAICAATHRGSMGHRRAHSPGLVAYLDALLDGRSNDEDNALEARNRDFPNELDQRLRYFEGAKKMVWVNAHERDEKARIACLSHYGYNCAVCDFNFLDKFGALGEKFIHVHHLNPMALTDGEYELNPVADLRPVCPNCHAMLHRKKDVLSIDELRNLLHRDFA